jgi:AIPR protein
MGTPIEAIADQVAHVWKEESYANEGDAFVHWYLMQRFDLLASEAADASAIGGPNDKGFDALWFDDDHRIICAAQCKYGKSGKASFGYEDATKLRSSLQYLKDPMMMEGVTNELLRDRLREVHTRLKANYDIQFYVVVLGEVASEARKEVHDLAKKAEADVQVFLHEANDVINVLPKMKQIADITADIPVYEGEMFEHSHDTSTSVIIAVGAKDLAGLREKFGDQLFNDNVRYYLGQRGANSGMVNSLKGPDGRRNFWFYHNGVTAIGSKVQPSEDGKFVRVEGLQIVNGCQTTVTLHETLHLYEHKDPAEQPRLLMRIIQTEGNDQLLRNISMFTNTQSAVNERDLAGKDRIQEHIQENLDHAGYFCEIKRGEWNILTPDQKKKYILEDGTERRVANIDLAKAIMCWEGHPQESKSRKSHFQAEPVGGWYEFIFKPERSAWEYLLANQIIEYCERRKAEFIAEYKEAERQLFEGLDEEELAILEARQYIAHADRHVCAYISRIVRDSVAETHYKDFVHAIEEGKTQPLDLLFGLVDSILTSNVRERMNERAFQLSRYWKSKKAWPDARSVISSGMNFAKQIAKKDPLETFREELNQIGVPAA